MSVHLLNEDGHPEGAQKDQQDHGQGLLVQSEQVANLESVI